MPEVELTIKNPWMDAGFNTCALKSKIGTVPVGLTLDGVAGADGPAGIAGASGVAGVAGTTGTTGAIGATTYLGLDDTFDTVYTGKKGFIPFVNEAETGLLLKENWPFPSGGDLYEPLFCRTHHKLQWGWRPEESMFVGFGAGCAITTGTHNTLGGFESGKFLTVEKGNTFYGARSGYLVGDIEGTEEVIETTSYDIKETEAGSYFQKYMPLAYWDGQLVTLNLTGTTTGYDIMGSTDGTTWTILKSTTGTNSNPTGDVPSAMASYRGSVWYSVYGDTTLGLVQQWDGSTLTGHFTSAPGSNLNIDHLYSWNGKLWAIHDLTSGVGANSNRLVSWTTGSTTWTTLSDYDGSSSYNYNLADYTPAQYHGQRVNHLFAFENHLYWICSRWNATSSKWEGKILKYDDVSAFDTVATIVPSDSYLHACGAVNVSGTIYLFFSEFDTNGSLSAVNYKTVIYTSTDTVTWTLWKDFGNIGLVCDLVYFNQRVFVNIFNPSNNYTDVYYLGITNRSLTKEVSISTDTGSNSGTFAQLGGYLYVSKYKGIYRRTASTWIQAIYPDDTFGSYNTFVGMGTGISNLTGRFNTLLGFLSDVANPELENAAAIGYRAIVGDSNTLVLGGTGAYAVNVCIGKTGGSERLDISGNAKVSGQFISGQATGTSPLSVQSTTVNTNLNADLLDGSHASAFASSAHKLLSATHDDTTVGTVLRGDIITGQGSTPTWTRLVKGTLGYFIKATADDAVWAAHGLTYTDVGAAASGHDHSGIYDPAGTGHTEAAAHVSSHESTYNHANYNTAYGWGNWAHTTIAGYGITDALSNPMTDIGDMIYGGVAGVPTKLADVAPGSYLRSGGVVTAPLWSTLILPNAATAYRLPVATSANTIGELAASGATGEYLKGNTGATPSFATLNQTAVAGLTTTDGPTFDHVHLTSGQVGFPAAQSASADVNTLDDYEEGIWTPGITFGGASVGVTYAADNGGFYTKIGNVVRISGILWLTNKGSSVGAALMTGLPFTINPAASGYSPVALYMYNVSFANFPQACSNPNTTQIILREITEAGVVTTLDNTNFANDSYVMVNCVYSI